MNADVLALALQEFRVDWGVGADPERNPDLWAVYVEDAKQVIADQALSLEDAR